MLKKILSLFVLTLCIVGNVSATYVPSPLYKNGQAVGAGTFYFYNIGANRYLNRGTNWDTHAVLDGAGLQITVAQMSNGGGSLYTGVNEKYLYLDGGNGVYTDGNAKEFFCEPVTLEGYTNAYKLKCDVNGTTYYLGWNGGVSGADANDVIASTSASSNAFYWLLISPSDRTFDYTNYITNPDFERSFSGNPTNWSRTQVTGWNRGGFKLQNTSQTFANASFAEKWSDSAPLGMDQCVQYVNLPDGFYTLTTTAQAIKQGNPDAASTKGVELFMGDMKATIGAAGTYSVTKKLNSQTNINIGVGILSDNDANWVAFDNMRLYREDIATYTINDNTLTFTGAGRLEEKTYTMTNYSVTLGNENELGEVPYVRALDNGSVFAACVIDRNGYDFAAVTNNLPDGWGTYYVIRPVIDGRLTAYVRGYNNNVPLMLVDHNGNVIKNIPGNEFSSGLTKIDLGYLIGGTEYYLYAKIDRTNNHYGTLFLQKTEFTTIASQYAEYGAGFKIVEYEDYEKYSQAVQSGTIEHVWTRNNSYDCIVKVDQEANNTHGPYAYFWTTNSSGDHENTGYRSAYYDFKELGSRKRYVIEFDANINPGSDRDSQIAIYRNHTPTNNEANAFTAPDNYLLSIEIPGTSNGTTWKFKVPGANNTSVDISDQLKKDENNNANLALPKSTWYHFVVDVDGRNEENYKIGIKVMNDNHQLIAQTMYGDKHGSVHFEGDYKALGIRYTAGRYTNQAKFDNILICSNQGSMGSLTAPTIAVTGISGNSRQVTITSGYAENNYSVKTYYEYTTDTSYNWGNLLANGNWTNWSSFDTPKANQPGAMPTPLTLTATSKTVYLVRAISTITDYATVQSDTAYLRVVVGEPWILTGGFAVQEMNLDQNSGYYTPKVRVYADTGIPGIDISKVNIKVGYDPLDYGIDYETDEFVDQAFVTLIDAKANTSAFTTADGITYCDIDVRQHHSGRYMLTISGDGYQTGSMSRYYYRDKYKVTYQTPDFSVAQPLTQFEQTNTMYNGVNSDNVLNRIYGYSPWSMWMMVTTPFTLEGWSDNGTADYVWNTYTTGKTATLNSIVTAKSGDGGITSGSTQTYDIRTIQYDTANPLILRNGWGLIKDTSVPWNYKCALAHIGMGNEIPEFTIDEGKGGEHVYKYVYPTPYITGSHVPECNYSVPARAALKQYKVYTPVETKVVNSTSGLASFSSYYNYYHVQDYFLQNDELVDTYCSKDHYAFGGNYYLQQTWYAKEREGWLLAATQYRGTDIWDGYKKFKNANPWNGESITVELKIVDGVNEIYWPKHNEIQPVLFNDETVNHSSHYHDIYGSSDQNGTGRPNMILYKGTRNGETAYNFYCLPTADTTAKMANKTAYLQREKNTYQDYLNSQSTSVKEEGENFIFGLSDDEGVVVGIDLVEDNVNMMDYDNGVFYNIAGQKVSTPTKGLYIVNGKKVLVK